jgi:penicillin-binding protein 1C
MGNVSGTRRAAPIWTARMNYLHRTEPSRAPVPPGGLVQARAQFGDTLEAARSEWFIQDTEQPLFAINSGASYAYIYWTAGKKFSTISSVDDFSAAHITAPASGTVIALDPDIPPNRQRLSFSAEGSGIRWLMDGKEFARSAETRWLRWPGRHLVQIADAGGKVADEIRLEVRDAGVRNVAAPTGKSGTRR